MRLGPLSLTTKLNLLLAIAAGVAFLVSCVAFVTNDVRMLRAAKIKHLLATAEALAVNSAEAVIQGDVDLAERSLAFLRPQHHITHAGIFDRQGQMIHHYSRAERPMQALAPQPPGYYFLDDGSLAVYQPIVDGGQHVGTVFVHSTLEDLREELIHYVRIVALIAVASLSASVVMSSRLQRLVSAPIVGLTEAAQRISASGDYSTRVQKQADDEIGALYDQFNAMLQRIARNENELQSAQGALETRVQERTAQLLQANLKLSREIAERQRAEQELAIIHQKLVDAAHRAGMAEIATDVLHNVGNVLNSVNVSCTLAAERLRNSHVPQVKRLAELLEQNAEHLTSFLTSDERGRQVPKFLNLLGDRLLAEQAAILREIDSLTKNVDHIKTIVAMQQSYAGISGVVEPVQLADLLEDAVKLNSSWLEKYSIEVIRQYDPLPETLVQKQKLLQVFVNLVQNARDALIESGRPDPRLILRISQNGAARARIDVIDNGIGIPLECMTRIFTHGFTTKQSGHGFGLHSCANAAKEMGGQLVASSDGRGCGATFTLELPLKPVEVPV
jgi:C4-dicarboxylate-specific signal transduction histidine kinase